MNWYKKSKLGEPRRDPNEVNLEDIPEAHRTGDCFEAAGRYLMDNLMFNRDDRSMVLVHGEVTGQGPVHGIRYGHAWIEIGDMVKDVSMGRDINMPKNVYYAVGNIDPSKVFRYTFRDMQKKLLEHRHWGPWDLKTKF